MSWDESCRTPGTSHYGAFLVNVTRSVVLDSTLNLVGSLLLLDFLGEVLLHVLLKLEVKVVSGGLQNDIGPAQWAVPFLSTLDLDDAANAKNVLAIKADRHVCYRKAHWAEVVVQLRNHRDELLRHLCADILGNAACQKFVGVYYSRELPRYAQSRTFIKL